MTNAVALQFLSLRSLYVQIGQQSNQYGSYVSNLSAVWQPAIFDQGCTCDRSLPVQVSKWLDRNRFVVKSKFRNHRVKIDPRDGHIKNRLTFRQMIGRRQFPPTIASLFGSTALLPASRNRLPS
jgi:hypothetical protein